MLDAPSSDVSSTSSNAGPDRAVPGTAPGRPAAASGQRGTFIRLLRLAAPEKLAFVGGTVALLVSSSLGLVYPQALRIVIDSLGSDRTRAIAMRAAGAMALIALLQGAAITARACCFGLAAQRIVKSLRERLFDALVHREISFFDTANTGELTNRLSNDTESVQRAITTNVSVSCRNVIQLAGSLGFLFWTSPRLTAILLLVSPVVIATASWCGKRIRTLVERLQDLAASANGVAQEALSDMRTVRMLTAESRESERYATFVRRSYDVGKSWALWSYSFVGLSTFAGYAAVAAVFGYGGSAVASGTLTVGALSSFLMYSAMAGASISALGEVWTDLMAGVGALGRIFELLDEAPDVAAPDQGTRNEIKGQVDFRHVSFAYPTRPGVPVVIDFTLRLGIGEVVGLVGRSGVGKSTMAALLTRMYDPCSGSILIDDHDIRSIDPSWLRKHIGFVSQDCSLFSTTLLDNLRYGNPEASAEDIVSAARSANAHEFISSLPDGYNTVVGPRGVQLSGGQRQRVAIARALIKNPRIVILDEATSALDSDAEQVIREALQGLLQNRTTLVISHRLSTLRMCQRVVMMEHGSIVQVGPHEALAGVPGLYMRFAEEQTRSA